MLVAAGARARLLDSEGSGGHEKALRPVPNIGGIGIFWGAVGPIGIGLLLLLVLRVSDAMPELLAQYSGRIQSEFGTWCAIVVSALVLHLVGLVDDRHALGAGLKLCLQLVLALLLVLLFDVRLLHMLDGHAQPWGWIASVVLSILWLVVITNAMNGWVTLSGRLFVPRVLEALERHGIEVMYAREKHGNTGDAEEWKMTAFASLVRRPAACAASGRLPAPARCSVL